LSEKHPYVNGTGVLVQVLDQLQKSFPSTVNSDWLKKLALASNNESYIINALRFLGLIDEEGQRIEAAQKVFNLGDPEQFKSHFSGLVEKAYAALFELHHEQAWSLGDDKLIPFFRQSDQTTQVVGQRQAGTFKILAQYSGKRAATDTARPKSATRADKTTSAKTQKNSKAKPKPLIERKTSSDQHALTNGSSKNIGLTVRIEVNLPATDDQSVYDKIFKSIRENLLNA
jgi:hypothetical protein